MYLANAETPIKVFTILWFCLHIPLPLVGFLLQGIASQEFDNHYAYPAFTLLAFILSILLTINLEKERKFVFRLLFGCWFLFATIAYALDPTLSSLGY